MNYDLITTLYLGFAIAASLYYTYKTFSTRAQLGQLESEIVEKYKDLAVLENKKQEFKNNIDEKMILYEDQKKLEIDIRIGNYVAEKEKEKDELFRAIEESYSEKMCYTQELTNTLEASIQEYKDIEQAHKESAQAAIEAAKREQQIKEQDNFYRIQLSEEDIEGISSIKNILKHFRSKNLESIQKIICKVYYERPVNDLLNRLLKSYEKTGIYKITDLDTGMCYIGQSVDIPARLKTHIKAGLGINSSNNRLYSTMKKKCPENFSYEIVELCSRDKLNEKERYWIDFYEYNKWGMNTLKGVNN